MEESAFAVESALRTWGFEVVLGLCGKTLLKCFIPIILCPISKGKK
jgi:hypothetical protein